VSKYAQKVLLNTPKTTQQDPLKILYQEKVFTLFYSSFSLTLGNTTSNFGTMALW
jgi:hypothetical protein